MRPRLVWNKIETRLVMAEVLRLQPLEVDFTSQAGMIIKAEKVLPPGRRLNAPRSGGFASVFFKRMKHLQESGHLKPATVAPGEFPVGVTAAARISTPNADEAGPEIIVIEKKVIVREMPDYGTIPTVTLARILLERLSNLENVEANMFNLTKSLEQKRDQERQYDRRLDLRPDASQPKADAIRICIIGLLPEQQHEVEAKTASVSKPIKLRFYDGHTGPQDLPNIVDYVIASRFVRHGWWEKAKSALPADCVFFLSGGIQEIIQKVYDLASRQTSPHLNGGVVR